MRKSWGLALLVGIALGGCGEAVAKSAQEQGNPCNASTLEPSNHTYSVECARQKHDEQVQGEAHEAEAVIKRRHAEELANIAEGR